MSTVLTRKEWLTVNEAAKFLNVSPGRVRQFLIGGRLQGVKFGPTWAIARVEVDRFGKLERPTGNPNFSR